MIDDSPEGFTIERGTIERGGTIPDTSLPAFTLKAHSEIPIPVLIAVPHGGRSYPEALTAQMRDPDFATIRLEDRWVDRIAQGVADRTGVSLLIAEAPRALIDLNRSPDDVDWGMIADAPPGKAPHSSANRRARSGLGLVPRRLPGLGEIWNRPLPMEELQNRIRCAHMPYHRALGDALNTIVDRWSAVLLIDMHSMPPLTNMTARARGVLDTDGARFVIGDRFGASADDWLTACALRYLGDAGVGAAHNRPYAGGYVLDRHAAPARGIHAIQLEICRSLYLDAAMRELTDGADALIATLAGLVRALGDAVISKTADDRFALAAE